MMEVLAGGLLGGLFGMLSAWFAIHVQTGRNVKALAAALYAEIESKVLTAEAIMAYEYYMGVLGDLITHGDHPNKEQLKILFENQGDTSPIYHACLANIGLLKAETSAALVRYHILLDALIETAKRFLLAPAMSSDSVKTVAYATKQQYIRMLAAQDKALIALASEKAMPAMPPGGGMDY